MDLESTVRDLAPRLLRFCRGWAVGPEAAEEAAQEALAALVARWRRSGPPDSPEAFVLAIARRRAVRSAIRGRLLAPYHVLGDGRESARAIDPGEGPEARAAARAELTRTLAALRTLSDRDRQAILLVAAAELSTEQAAAVAGVSRSAFKMRVHRARRRLTEILTAGSIDKEEVPHAT